MKKKITIAVLLCFSVLAVILIACTKNIHEEPQSANASASAFASRNQVSLSDMELLGKSIFYDNISVPDNMSCATCHDPAFGFTGPVAGQNLASGIYRGAISRRFGNRKPPSAAYATLSPVLYYDAVEELFIGGNFWDGRATGQHLGNPAADQALGPFLNPVEQNHPSKESVLKQIAASRYTALWQKVWGTPVSYTSNIDENYDRVGLAIAAYEGSAEVNAFSSKFDFALQNGLENTLTAEEFQGWQLFNGKGLCANCHTSDGGRPLFTDFTYDNLGVPKNPENPFYRMNTVYLDNGDPINPEGPNWIDGGLGAFLQTVPAWQSMAQANWGKHKVPTLRNVDKRPGPGVAKAYMHNGVFKSLEEVVHFYNTRDVKPWPAPEVAANVNTEEMGNLGLTPAEEKAIVAFMRTLSDGWVKGFNK